MIYPGRGKTFAKESSLSEAKAEKHTIDFRYFCEKHFQPLPTLHLADPATITNFLDYKTSHSLHYRQYQIVSLTFKFLPSILKSKNSEFSMQVNLDIRYIDKKSAIIFDNIYCLGQNVFIKSHESNLS